jgi:hypothetical protein
LANAKIEFATVGISETFDQFRQLVYSVDSTAIPIACSEQQNAGGIGEDRWRRD